MFLYTYSLVYFNFYFVFRVSFVCWSKRRCLEVKVMHGPNYPHTQVLTPPLKSTGTRLGSNTRSDCIYLRNFYFYTVSIVLIFKIFLLEFLLLFLFIYISILFDFVHLFLLVGTKGVACKSRSWV